MKAVKLFTIVSVLGLVFLTQGWSTTVFGSGFTIIRLPTHSHSPAISGSLVVYAKVVSCVGDDCIHGIYLFNFNNGSIRLLTQGDWRSFPDISGSKVVWTQEDGNIYLHDILTSNTKMIGTGETPAVSGSGVVWHNNNEIYLYDGSTIKHIGSGIMPSISGSKVAWVASDSAISLYDDANETTMTIPESGGGTMPDISGTRVVFEKGQEIYYYDGTTTVQLTNTSGAALYNRDPAISGSNIVWYRLKGGTSNPVEICLYDGTDITIVAESARASHAPDISGASVVWVGLDEVEDDRYVTLAVNQDQYDYDGDGLLNSWENTGIDYNGDGTIDLDLTALDAQPYHKDLFIEVDVMERVPFSQEAIDMVVRAFARSPVDNPDGHDGITFHVNVDDTLPFYDTLDDDFVEFDQLKNNYFGPPPGSPNRDNIIGAMNWVYRYCIVANRFTPSGAVGWGEMPGNDFAIAFGGLRPQSQTVLEIATTFMHELGHNLALGHGGGDDINYKPNYVSVMNYGYDEFADGNGNPLLPDFSSEILSPLDEMSLNEHIGIPAYIYPGVWTFYGLKKASDPEPRIWHSEVGSARLDWNRDNIFEVSVQVDLNYLPSNYPGRNKFPSPNEIMYGYNDWDLVELPIGMSGDFAPYVHNTIGDEEITEDIVEWLKDNVPKPHPAPCIAGDFDCDTWVKLDDFAILAAAWRCSLGQTAYNPICDISEPNDGVINENDLARFAHNYLHNADFMPPVPNPITWAAVPYATGNTSIAMRVNEASDVSGVEYYFQCTAGDCHDSGWQDSNFFEDVNLLPERPYTYRVMARDKSLIQNPTGWSIAETATTDAGCPPASFTHVESVVCDTISGSQGNSYGQATITIYDNCGSAVADADVTGTFTGDFNEQHTETTNANGVVIVTTSVQTKNPSYTFCVDDVNHVILWYDPNDNVETCENY